MSVAFSEEAKQKFAKLIRPDPHCIAWVRATACLFGNSSEHELDEPVPLTEVKPVRVRLEVGSDHRDRLMVVFDRPLSLKTFVAGTHACLRLTFDSGKFFEIAVGNIDRVNHGETAEIRP